MILWQQLCNFVFTASLALMLATVMAFGLVSEETWAVTSPASVLNQPPTQIAFWFQAKEKIENAEGKAEEAIGEITSDTKVQAEGKAKQFKAKTLEGMSNSIVNSNYKPDGKTKKVENQIREATQDIKAEARDAFN
jgi:uncharacterized protein YjbJ (UPF0337 family)